MKIDKNIPLPENKRGKWLTSLKDMEVGDSVLLKKEHEYDTSASTKKQGITGAFRKYGWKFISRNLKPFGEEEEIRLWRIE